VYIINTSTVKHFRASFYVFILDAPYIHTCLTVLKLSYLV